MADPEDHQGKKSSPEHLRGPGRPSHDRNLRSAILEQTVAMLEDTGDPATVTIARVVAAAHCSPPTLYHYWPTRDDLLQEAAEAGWAEFRAGQRVTSRPADPIAEIEERGRRYLRFALERPGLFRALFLSRVERAPDRLPEPGPALVDFIDAVGRVDRDSDPNPTALALWSAVHGLATLAVNAGLPHDLVWVIFERQQHLMLDGLHP